MSKSNNVMWKEKLSRFKYVNITMRKEDWESQNNVNWHIGGIKYREKQNEWINKWINKWKMNEWMNEWMNEFYGRPWYHSATEFSHNKKRYRFPLKLEHWEQTLTLTWHAIFTVITQQICKYVIFIKWCFFVGPTLNPNCFNIWRLLIRSFSGWL